jgi:hypothetical protein
MPALTINPSTKSLRAALDAVKPGKKAPIDVVSRLEELCRR